MAIKISNQNSFDTSNIIYQQSKIKTSEKKAKIIFMGENAPDPVTVDLDDLPKTPKLPTSETIESCLVVYDTEKQEVLAINPFNGVFEAVGVGLGPRESEDSDIVPFEKTGKDQKTGGEYTIHKFYEQFKITDKEEDDGLFYGATPRWYLQFKFHKRDDDMTDVSGTEKSKWTQKLYAFGDIQGLFEDDIAWDDDDEMFGGVLNELEERILENKTKVRLQISNGYVETILPARGYSKSRKVVEEDEDDDEPDFLKDDEDIEEVQEKVHFAGKSRVKSPAKVNGKAKPAVKKVSKKRSSDEDDDL